MSVIAKVGSQQQSSTLKSISSKIWIHHFNQILNIKKETKISKLKYAEQNDRLKNTIKSTFMFIK